jgi:hypothetical protein
MTTEFNTGGPAHPIGNESGLSMRDYFASAIITGIYMTNSQGDHTTLAESAYKQADAMLIARTKALVDVAPTPEPTPTPAPEPTPESSTQGA